jgi:urocanate hydratase
MTIQLGETTMKNLKALLIGALVVTSGCATMLNPQEKTLYLAEGVTIDGETRTKKVDQKETYTVEYADGRESCELEPEVSTAYFVLDLFATAVIGLVVDAVTGDWRVIDAGECEGVADSMGQF